MREKKDRFLRPAAAHSGDEISVFPFRREHFDVRFRKTRREQPRHHRLGRRGHVADRFGRVDLDELLIDVAYELAGRVREGRDCGEQRESEEERVHCSRL